ncbi:MAG: hypothetical protein CSB55_07605 [Candidatus Cloacimonadota bacterium]|nr:MAG: hypothetical protein CSB55_07605 [Candidatus Cloacimonadota bacterium]
MGIKEILRQVEFFSNLNDDQLNTVIDGFKEERFRKGDIIIKEKEKGDSFYILKEGKVEILLNIDKEGIECADLRVFQPYEYFGEMALIDNSPRSATAVAVTDEVVLLKMHKCFFMNICLVYPEVVFSLMRTMSERLRNTNSQFADVVRSLLKKNKMGAIGSAAGKIVHDIKTPLTIIILTAQLVERLFPEAESYVNKIIKQTRLMDDMIKEILHFARGEKIELDLSVTYMKDFMKEIEENMVTLAEDVNVELYFENSLTDPVVFDIQKIKRTVTNIIKNGIEALKENGKIKIKSFAEDNFIVIQIKDNGSGIPENILPDIFEPFTTFGKKSGTGLGLAICKKVIDDHKGKLTARNLEEGGAEFTISIPLKLDSNN